ncbi:MAG: cofactor-independent phosphoglycerate mutase [Candidatus Hadarchaeales archaeon]
MKYVVVVGDGMADYPLEELGGKTPLQVANKPNMDSIASRGMSGLLRTIPTGMEPGSDVAIMSILGYNPKKFHTGRGPLEAAALGVRLSDKDVAFRCNLITEENGLIKDYSAGHISTEEARILLNAVAEKYGDHGEFYPGVSYRHLFVMRNVPFSSSIRIVPPHDALGERVADHLASPKRSKMAQIVNQIMLGSKEILSGHRVNVSRVRRGKAPANMVWLWGQGRKPRMKTMRERFGLDGAVISAVTVVKGTGICAGLESVEVPGATGYYDTSYGNKARYALKVLKEKDMVLVHVESPDEAGHEGNIEEKIRAIENIDSKIVGRIMDGTGGECKIAVMADHPTPIRVRTHTPEPVPFSMTSSSGKTDGVKRFDEFSARGGKLGLMEGHRFIRTMVEF